MNKSLNEMTNEELWQLFPIILSDYDENWPNLYLSEINRLTTLLNHNIIHRAHHIGSTSVPGLVAKPTIDILLEINHHTDTQTLINGMTDAGYIFNPQPLKPPPHMMFMQGYTPTGFCGQVFHVHIRYPGHWDEVRFRDYLRCHHATAQAYVDLKRRLQKCYQYNRDAYTDAKTAFIQHVLSQCPQGK